MKTLVARGYGWMQAHPAAISFALLALVAAVGLRGEETRDEGQATRKIVERVVVEVEVDRHKHHSQHPKGVTPQPTGPSGHQQPSPPSHGGHPGNGGGGNPTPETAPEVRASDNTPPVPAVVEHVEEVVGQTPAGPVLETVNGTACHLVASC